MTFSKEVIDKVRERLGGYCECEYKSCGHTDRCNKQLVYANHKEGERSLGSSS